MSMYHMMMGGVNPYAPMLTQLLGFTDPLEQVPRLRDCYVDGDNNIVVFTRTGGGNRPDYVAENETLRARAGFLRDEDWETDSTYAKWIYAAPAGSEKLVAQLAEAGAYMDPTEKFNAALSDLGSDNPGPRAKAAMTAMLPVMQQLMDFINGKSNENVILVDGDAQFKVEE